MVTVFEVRYQTADSESSWNTLPNRSTVRTQYKIYLLPYVLSAVCLCATNTTTPDTPLWLSNGWAGKWCVVVVNVINYKCEQTVCTVCTVQNVWWKIWVKCETGEVTWSTYWVRTAVSHHSNFQRPPQKEIVNILRHNYHRLKYYCNTVRTILSRLHSVLYYSVLYYTYCTLYILYMFPCFPVSHVFGSFIFNIC